MYNQRVQEVYGSYIHGFSEKSFVQRKWATLGMKMMHPYNFGSILRIVLKFWEMKGAKRFMENHFNGLLGKKIFLGVNGLFWAWQMNHFEPKHDAF